MLWRLKLIKRWRTNEGVFVELARGVQIKITSTSSITKRISPVKFWSKSDCVPKFLERIKESRLLFELATKIIYEWEMTTFPTAHIWSDELTKLLLVYQWETEDG